MKSVAKSMALIFLTVLILLTAGCGKKSKTETDLAPATDYRPVTDRLSKFIKKQMKEEKVVGLSITLVDDQSIVWSEGFGFADKKGKVRADSETVYCAGGISKILTAMAVMQLRRNGIVDTELPLQGTMPEFSMKVLYSSEKNITPRNIMSHHSGLPREILKGQWTKDPKPFESQLDQVGRMYAVVPPMEVLSYSNMGYSLLGIMIQERSGLNFEEYMERYLFGPIGMKNTSYKLSKDVDGGLAKGYINKKLQPVLNFRDVPAGAMKSNVSDMARLMMMVFANGRAGTQSVVDPESITKNAHPAE